MFYYSPYSLISSICFIYLLSFTITFSSPFLTSILICFMPLFLSLSPFLSHTDSNTSIHIPLIMDYPWTVGVIFIFLTKFYKVGFVSAAYLSILQGWQEHKHLSLILCPSCRRTSGRHIFPVHTSCYGLSPIRV